MKINIKIISSVAGASVILTFLGIFSKGIGFIREIIYANNFGLSTKFDLFLTSIAIPIVINTAMIYLSQHYFIPTYNKIRNKSEAESVFFFNYTFWFFLLAGILIAVSLLIFSNLILDFYLSSISIELKEEGLTIFLIFLVTLPLNAGISVITAYMQANFNFVFPAVSQLVLNVVVIILIVLFTKALEILILPISFSIAYFIAFILLWYQVREKLKFRPISIFNFKKESNINALIALIFIEVLSLSYILIDRYFIGDVPEGGIAALNYALVIYLLPVTIFSLPLITTIFSKFSKLLYNSTEILKTDFANALRINFFIITPLTFLLFFEGNFFLTVFYERGKFSSIDTITTHSVLKFYCISLIFYTSYLIIVKMFYSVNKYYLVLMISVIAFLLKIFLNLFLVEELKQNGLALSTSIIYIFLFFSGIYLGMQLLNIKNKSLFTVWLMYFITSAIISYLISTISLIILPNGKLIADLIQIIIFVFFYVVNSFLLKDNEYVLIKNSLVSIFKK